MSNRSQGNRAAAMEVLKYIDEFMPGSPNYEVMKQRLDKLSDKEFDAYMEKLGSGEEILPLFMPNMGKYKITVERNLKLAKKLGHEFFERVWMTDLTTGKTFLTPEKYLVMDLPIRRQQQLLIKKINIPEDNMHVDELTGQPTGPSKGAKLSFPEIQALYAQGMDQAIEELIKFRGGDQKAYRAMVRTIVDTGNVRQASIRTAGTRVKSTETLSTLLKGAHLNNTL